MLNKTHQLFGHNTPRLSNHTFQRYAERIFNVDDNKSLTWSKNKDNRIRVVKDFYGRLPKCEIINTNKLDADRMNYFQSRYGNDVVFLKHNKYVFVVREFKIVVTVFKEENE
jgi:hypothetical protein